MGKGIKVGAVCWPSLNWGAGRLTAPLSQVLSHNLYTVLHIPHDPVALEEHFRDDDDGPVSSQGYMPYLNKYILDKVGPVWGRHLYLSHLPGSTPIHVLPAINSHSCLLCTSPISILHFPATQPSLPHLAHLQSPSALS